MNSTIGLLISVTLFITMFALGLSLRLEALRQWWTRPALPLRILLGSSIGVPLLALLLLLLPWSFTIPQAERTAIALMAICPSAPLTLRKARKAGGDHQLAAFIQIGAAMAAIASIPLIAVLFRHTFNQMGWAVQPLDIALQVGRVQVLPLLLAMGLREWRTEIANRLEGPLDQIANLLLAALTVLVLLKAGPVLLATMARNQAAVLLMILVAVLALLIGWSLAGRHNSLGVTTALVTANRNPGLALLLAHQYGQGIPGLKAAILVNVVVILLVSLGLMRLAGSQPLSKSP